MDTKNSVKCNRAIVILADGARTDVMNELISSGSLPNISRYLIEGGSNLSAITGFPSTTGPAYLPFLTGCLPGTCNVPGIRWFDKIKYDSGWSFDRYRSYVGFESLSMGRDIWQNIKTIFELLPNSYSIFNPIACGSKNVTLISRIWHWYYSHLTDHWDFTDDSALTKLIGVLDKDPKFIFAVFPGIDVYSHLTHPRHESVMARYRALDNSVGVLADELGKRGMFKDTAVFIVSDHGLSTTHTHFCVNEFLEGHNLPPFYYPLIFEKKGKLSANMVSGNGMTHIYFKNADGWARRTVKGELLKTSPRFLEDMLKEPAVDIMAIRDEDGFIEILSRRGAAKIKLDGNTLCYKVTGSDPFGYPSMPETLDEREILKLTYDSEYPDAPFQIAHLMMSPRSGDVIISATPGYDLRVAYEDPEHKASHGSLHRSHMSVPIISNVPFEYRCARTVDVFPTILGLLDCEVPGYIDGKGFGPKDGETP